MSTQPSQNALTEFVESGGIRYAYRRFGKRGTAPLLCLGYFNSNMDAWDPRVMNGLAEEHEVILFDNAGVASSTGETPSHIEGMSQHVLSFCEALGLKAVNILGFSLGGMIAQQLALDRPELVQKLILLGTGPRGGVGMTYDELSPDEQADPVAFLLAAFFTPSEESQSAGRQYVARLSSRTKDRDLPVSKRSAEAQLAALIEWGIVPATNRYDSLKCIHQATLICHGTRDIVVRPINALILMENLPNATLIAYPDASHGAQYQHSSLFLEHVRLFFHPEQTQGDAASGSR